MGFFNRLQSVHIHNFCSIENLDLNIENQRLTHIIGINNDDELSPSNGSGKSTIKSAICWNLFGVTETGRQGDSILPWGNPKNCAVETVWTNGSDVLRIFRYRAHKEKKNLIELFLSNKDITGKDNDDTQSLINNYLGFNLDLFCLLLTTGLTSKKMKDIMFMTDKEKKEFLGFLLDLSFLDSAQQTVKDRLKFINDKLNSHTTEHTATSAKLESAQDNLKDYQKRVETHAIQIQEQIDKKTVEIAGMEAEVPKKRKALENLREEVKKIVVPEAPDTSKIDANRGQIKAYYVHNEAQQIEKTRVSKELLILTKALCQDVIVDENTPVFVKIQAALSVAQRELVIKESFTTEGYTDMNIDKLQKAIYSDEHQLESAKVELEKAKTATHDTLCPTCGRLLDPEHIEKIELDRLSNMKNAQEQVDSYTTRIELRKKKLTDYKTERLAELTKINLDKIADLKAEICQVIDRLDSLRKSEFARLSKERNVDSIQAQISSLNAEMVTIESILSVNNKNIAKLETEVSIEDNDLRDIQAKVLELTRQKVTLKAEFTALKVEYDNFKVRIEAEKQGLVKLDKEKENNPYKQFVDSVQKEIESLQERHGSINREIEKLNEDVVYLEFWYNGFGDKGIKSYVLDSITELLEQKANFALGHITNGNVSIGFCTQKKNKSSDIVRDEFTAEIFRDGQGVQFVDLSKGERCRVSFAVNYALKALGTYYHGLNLNFEWYDEVLDGLDEIGCYQVIQFLRHELKNYESIFVVSHNENVKNLFDKNLIIEKTDGKSVLKNE